MKIAVIGAAGNLGSRVTRQAAERGMDVEAIVREGESLEHVDERAVLVIGDLFALTAHDLADVDVLVSCFGSGPKTPELNEQACEAYLELARVTGVRVVAIMGSGCLFTDETHVRHVYESAGHPGWLAPISAYASRGLEQLDAAKDVPWTVVTPSLTFDAKADACGQVRLDTSRVVQRDAAGESYSTYEDVARVMLDEAETGAHEHQLVSVLSLRG